MKDLTDRQEQILLFIRQFIVKKGYPPTLREIGENFEITSTNGVNDHLLALERKGYIKRGKDKSRALELTQENPLVQDTSVRSIPVVGRIAAGQPILAQENIEKEIKVDADLFSAGKKEIFSVVVQGDSMTGDGINDGDYVFLNKEAAFNESDIFAVLVDDEVTLKRIKKYSDKVELIPSNRAYGRIVIDKQEGKNLQVLGRMIGLLRIK